jgi:type II secretory pathway pseudopilin PulG
LRPHQEARGPSRLAQAPPLRPPGGAGLPEAAFSLIEVVIAMAVLMLALAGLAVVITDAFAAVALSRQSQQADYLASAVLAQDEALPWATLSEGLSSSDANFLADEGASHNIVPTSGGYCFEGMSLVVGASAASSCTGTSSTWYNLAPLATCQASVAPTTSFPEVTSGSTSYLAHEQCVDLNGTNFQIGVYPTKVGAEPLTAELQVTVEVSWGSATSQNGTSTHVSDSVVLTCGTTDGLSSAGC